MGRPLRSLVVLIILRFIFFHSVLAEAGTGDPQVRMEPPRSYRARRIFLFPLEIPRYVFRIATWPLAATGRFIERNHVVERTIDLLSNDERTFWVYPIVEIGAGSGVGVGLGLKHSDLFHKGYHFSLFDVAFTDLDQRAGFSFSDPEAFEIAGRPFFYGIKAGYTRESDEDFFGFGNGSARADFSEFGFDDLNGGFSVGYFLLDRFKIEFETLVRAGTSRSSNGTVPPTIEATFPVGTLAGFDRWITYLDLGINLVHDTRDATAMPERGGLRSFSFHRFQGIGQKGFDYNEYRLDLRQFIRLWGPRRVLALRNAWTFQQETGTSVVPFYRLSFLDLNTPLRGFDRGRFRDHGSVIFNVEYRYPVWDIIDGTIFFDTGRVFDDPSDFSFNNFKYSVGGGIQFVTKNFLLFRIQAAYGGERVNIVLTAKKAL